MKKTALKIMSLIFILLVSFTLLAACDNGEKNTEAQTDGQQTGEQSTNEKSTGEQSTDEQPTDEQPTGEQPHQHIEEILPAKIPTCTEAGLTEGKVCSVCGEILAAQEEVPATGHNYENYVCNVCGNTIVPSQGLEFTSYGNGICYVSGIGNCTDTEVVIPSASPDGDIVFGIGYCAFFDCVNITSIFIPDSVIMIGEGALCCI